MATTKRAGRKAGQGSKWIRPEKRLAIYARDSFCCQYCGAGAEEVEYLTIDHVLACELGGTNHESNLVTACPHCNSAKQDLTMRQWYAGLRDQGIDTSTIAPRIRRQTAKKLDTKTGRALLAARKEARIS